MKTFSQHPARLAALLEQALQEQKRCEHLQDTWASVDSQAADACQFDTGALYACQRVLKAVQGGEDIVTDITSLIDLITELNNERRED